MKHILEINILSRQVLNKNGENQYFDFLLY